MVIDPENKIGIPYRVMTLPRAFLINQEGEIVETYTSYKEEEKEELRQSIIDLIQTAN